VVIQKQFNPLETLALIQQHKIQGMVGVPAMFQMMAAMPTFASTDLSSVIAFTSGGAPLPLHTIELYRARGIVFRQGYGLTEAAPGVTGMEPQDAFLKIGSVGRPCHHTEVRVVDENDQDCAPGVSGEVIVRGPNIMPGYWNRPQESAETLRGGWLRTGDAGHFDTDGYLFVAGRIKEMIITGGENVYPAEVVNALMEHPSVADAAVIGMPDEKWGQRPVAFIVAWPGKPVDAAGLGGYLEGRLARYKHPREYHFVPALPRNATGKVVRAGLVELLAAQGRSSTP
jgi:fatty-acyl-CoA synthase